MKRKLKKLGLVVLALVIVGLIGLTITGIVFTRQLNAEIAAIKARGEPITPKEFAGKPIPDSQNAAVLYMAAEKKIDSDAYRHDVGVARSMLRKHMLPLDQAAMERMSKALSHLQPVFSLITTASSRPQCRFPSNPRTGEADIAQQTGLWTLCHLLRASSALNSQTGDMDRAVNDITAQFRMAAQLKQGSTLTSQSMRAGLISIAALTTTEAAQFGTFSDTQCRLVYDAVADIDLVEGYRQAWLGERVILLLALDPTGVEGMQDAPPIPDPIGYIYEKTAFRGDLAVGLRFIARQLDGIDLGYREAVAQGLIDEQPDFPVYAILSKIMSPVFASSSFARFRADEQLAETRMFLALQAYKARYGGYPATMQELKTKLGWTLPKDPFSGKDFIYKRLSKGFIIYSVGPDMKDDGGRSLGDRVELDSKGDIVLRWDR